MRKEENFIICFSIRYVFNLYLHIIYNIFDFPANEASAQTLEVMYSIVELSRGFRNPCYRFASGVTWMSKVTTCANCNYITSASRVK